MIHAGYSAARAGYPCSNQDNYKRIYAVAEQSNFDLSGNMDGGVPGLFVWTGSSFEETNYQCSDSDAGPCWEPDDEDVCCATASDGSWTDCRKGEVNLEGQFSNTNTNQHFRCHCDDNNHNSLSLFVRPLWALDDSK